MKNISVYIPSSFQLLTSGYQAHSYKPKYMSKNVSRFFPTLLSILIITPLGFFTKLYSENGETWINNHLGGTFYLIFWCLVVYLIFSKGKPLIITGWVLGVTVLLEFLQLYHQRIANSTQFSPHSTIPDLTTSTTF